MSNKLIQAKVGKIKGEIRIEEDKIQHIIFAKGLQTFELADLDDVTDIGACMKKLSKQLDQFLKEAKG